MTHLSLSISRLLVAALLATASATPLLAHDYTAGPLRIVHPWSRATPPGAKVAGGFLTIENTGTTPDRLVGGTLVTAGRLEVHTMTMDGGVMTMRQLENGLEIPPGATVELKPGSLHVMFMDLKSGLQQGDRVKGTLVFEKAGKVEVEYKIEAVGAKASGGGEHAGHGASHDAGHSAAHGAAHGSAAAGDHSGHTMAGEQKKAP